MAITDKIVDRYDAFCKKHPRVDFIIPMIALGCAGTALLQLGVYSADKCIQAVRNRELRPDDRKATLIAHTDKARMSEQANAGTLFFDLDGDLKTAEAVVNYHTVCPHTIEAVRQIKIGDVRKVSEWKSSLSHDCWEKHYEWQELQRR